MRTGLFLTNEHTAPADLAARLPDQLRLASMAAEAGWSSVFTGQHYISEGTQRTQPIPFLARLSAEVPGLTLGTGIYLGAVAHPVSMAEDFASLDVLSGGHAVAGLGLGYRDEEFAAFGVERKQRVRRFERNLEIARDLWSGEPVDADEPWCRLEGATIGVLPVQDPLPVWIGGTGDAAVRRAALRGQGWIINPAAPAATLVDQAALYRSTSQKAGRGPGHVAAFREVFCAADDETARERALPYLAAKYGVYASWGQAAAHPGQQQLDGPTDQVAEGRFIVGGPETCRAALAELRDQLGVDELIVRTDWPELPPEHAVESLALLAAEVVPAL
ncbi:LLM class flavin-dependent oxidoreductase [Nocardioides sp. C4-1]|uniref:LLM class flavin-dependent oxidoreductase n=1 Tax=Nocardioides sp. C4-1 TaxID=3151851 RepID=UPI0032671476